jgi:DNA-binding response OmpR family regulator
VSWAPPPTPADGSAEQFLVYPNPPDPLLARLLDSVRIKWTAVANVSEAMALGPVDQWAGGIISADPDLDGAFTLCRGLRKSETRLEPVMIFIRGDQLDDLEMRESLFEEFCLLPLVPQEFSTRLALMLRRAGINPETELIDYRGLVLNPETYQAAVGDRPLDLTFMEYELLKFFATHPGKAFTRETLLSRVWGYEYYGGARTVDVHVRRLRAKLGDEYAGYIQTVRSVGYRFGSGGMVGESASR